jgi:hypothetical protein
MLCMDCFLRANHEWEMVEIDPLQTVAISWASARSTQEGGKEGSVRLRAAKIRVRVRRSFEGAERQQGWGCIAQQSLSRSATKALASHNRPSAQQKSMRGKGLRGTRPNWAPPCSSHSRSPLHSIAVKCITSRGYAYMQQSVTYPYHAA